MRLLFDNPMHPYTLGLLKSIPRLEDDDSKRLYMIKGMVPNPLEMPPGCHFSDRCDSCMQVCRERMPELVQVGDHKVRCFLYEEQDGHAKDAAEVKANEEKARELASYDAVTLVCGHYEGARRSAYRGRCGAGGRGGRR